MDECDNWFCVGGVMAGLTDSVIVQDPEIHSGEPVFRGTRVPFQTLLDYLEGGETLDEFLEQYPGVSREAAIAALEEAKTLLLARFGK
jgi:uncharacterized protein (DUF433 family)